MAVNNVLKDKLGNIFNPKIPRYERLADYTLGSDSNEMLISNLNIKSGTTFKMVIDGTTTTANSELVNVGCYPNGNENFTVARVVGFENNAKNINSVYNASTSNMYLGRVARGNQFIIDSAFSWSGTYLKNISSYATPATDGYFIFGNLSAMLSFSDETLTSIKITIASGQFVAGTRVKIYGKV